MTASAKSVYARFALAVVVTLVLAPMLAAWVLPETRWHRVTTRTFLITVILIFAQGAGHPRSWLDKLRAMGVDGPLRGQRFLIGVLVATIFMGILLLAEVMLGGRGRLQCRCRGVV